MVAWMLHKGSKGLRTAVIPQAFAPRKTARRTAGNICACLWVSMWVSCSPLLFSRVIWAEVSAWISAGMVFPLSSTLPANGRRDGANMRSGGLAQGGKVGGGQNRRAVQ